MSATLPIGVDAPLGTGEDAVKRQLDALVSGECDHITFLNAMKERFSFEPDENWEVLSLLDQYYRRGKIPVDVFRAIKNGFAEYILGPQVAMPTLHTVATPTPTPATPSAKAMPASPARSAPATAAATPAVSAPAAQPASNQAPAYNPPPAYSPPPALTPAHTFTGSPSQASIAAGKANAAPVREVAVGDVLRDRYRVESILARGGSGTVFEILDSNRLNLPPAGKRLAMKVPRTADARGNSVSQLRNEFHQLQFLSHPNIVRAFDFDRDGTLSFLTMELLHGVHLTQVVQGNNGRTLPRAYALSIIRDLASAIAYAHSRGVVHGDVNPQNVFITMAGEVRLLGFGAANKMSAAAPMPDFERASAASDTHRYASCEVFEGSRPDGQDDIYSLSCVAYLLLKGKHPYAGSTSVEARASRLRPSRPSGMSYLQWRMLRAGLRTEAKNRPGTVQEWLEAMELGGAAQHLPAAKELIEASGDQARRYRYVAAALVIAAFLGVGYWFSTSSGTLTFPQFAGEPASKDQAAPPSFQPETSPPPAAVATPRPSPSPAPQPAVKAQAAQPTPRPLATTAAPPVAAPVASTGTATSSTSSSAAAVAAARAAGGPARVEMTSDTLDALPTDTAVHVTVRRKGNLRGITSFTWWTESGTAKPGTDFSPVLPHIVEMQDGESSTVLTVPLLSTLRAQEKGFYIGIESTDGGAQIGARALTQISLPPTN